MIARAIVVEGHIDPTSSYDELELPTPSFQATLRGDRITARPTLDLEPAEAADLLRKEVTSVLPALAAEIGGTIGFVIDKVESVDPANPSKETVQVYVRHTTDALIAPSPQHRASMEERMRHTLTDQILAELLTYLGEARTARNPRPAAYKILDRLERVFGGRRAVKEALGVTDALLRPVVADQAEFEGDRHANHPVGQAQEPIDHVTRADVLGIAKELVDRYETVAINPFRGPPLPPGG